MAVFARPTSEGFSYESAGGATLGLGTGPPVVGLDGATTFTAFPDEDGDAAIARGGDITTLTRTGPALRHTPLDAVGGPLVLDLVQSASRSELRVVGPGAPSAPLTSAGGLQAIPATLARDGARLYVAYVSKHRLTLATAPARPTGTWSRRRLSVRGALNGAPAVMRVGSRTLIATSRRAGGRSSIYLTTAGPARTSTVRLTRAAGSDVAPLAAAGPDGRAYVGWSHRARGSARRAGVLRRVL